MIRYKRRYRMFDPTVLTLNVKRIENVQVDKNAHIEPYWKKVGSGWDNVCRGVLCCRVVRGCLGVPTLSRLGHPQPTSVRVL